MGDLSPMMKQYKAIKEQNKDSILFFRIGDFYEMFFEDAKVASEELDLVLTGKDCGQDERAPMCGVPFHSAESYVARLVENGHKVAICEQVEDPATAKGLVKRDIIRIITPGTVIEDTMLEEGRNNYLCAIAFLPEDRAGLCFCDASTGETHVTDVSGEGFIGRLTGEIGRFSPSEVLVCEQTGHDPAMDSYLKERFGGMVTERPKEDFQSEKARQTVLSHFRTEQVGALGIPEDSPGVLALGAVIRYLYETALTGNIAMRAVSYYRESQFMRLDATAVRNLEITETIRSKSKKGSLFWAIDRTRTAMGKRLMHSWMELPLMSIAGINARHNAVEELCEDTVRRGEIRERLSGIKDIERLIARVVYATGSARELRALADTAALFPDLKQALSGVRCRMLCEIDDDIDLMEDVLSLINAAIADEPPALVREGGMIRDGYNEEVDSLRNILGNGTALIAGIEARERERTGIKNLKVKFNKVFGYYIEVTNSFLNMVPEDYVRRQTLTGAERFVTPELKELEGKMLGAKDRIVALEYELFDGVRRQTAAAAERFQKTASALARLDVLASMAEVAATNRYCRPHFNGDGVLRITGGRHPVVEKLTDVPFVANDTYLDNKNDRCAIITGPNMAGKSTYMRQVAIIVLLAQMGSFVPAESADLCLVDAIFTRVGASDDLAFGQSTFMVEMSEVADIIKNATANSLLILDEIGRGTSTFDGMAIARSVLEYAADKKKLGAKTLFATHYHELTAMEQELDGIRNYHISVKKRGDDIIFLRRIVSGGASASYGIEVAKLAGLPDGVVKRAKQILAKSESEGPVRYQAAPEAASQMSFESSIGEDIVIRLRQLELNNMTPLEAFRVLSELVEKAGI